MKRFVLAFLAAVSGVATARAQDDSGLIEREATADRRLVRYRVIEQAINTNAQVFGAVGAFDTRVRPILSRPWQEDEKAPRYVVFFDYHSILSAAYTKADCSGECAYRVGMYPVDLFAGSFGFGLRNRYFGTFASFSYTAALLANPTERFAAIEISLLAPFAAPVLGGARFVGVDAVHAILPGGAADGIVGGFLDLPLLQGYAGYVASRGVFSDLTLPDLDAFANVAVATGFSRLVELSAGLREAHFWAPPQVIETIGRTSAFVRRAELVAPSLPTAGSAADAARESTIGLLSAHLQQIDIGSHVDVLGSYLIQPTATLQDALLSLHTRDYYPNLRASRPEVGELFGARITGGVVRAPARWYLGVGPETLYSFNLEAFSVSDAAPSVRRFSAFFRYNDPDTLLQFPFARDSTTIGMTLAWQEKPE